MIGKKQFSSKMAFFLGFCLIFSSARLKRRGEIRGQNPSLPCASLPR